MTQPFRGRTTIDIVHPDQDLSWRTPKNPNEVVARLHAALNGIANGAAYATTTAFISQGGVQATADVTLSGVGGTAATGTVTVNNVGGTAASGTVTLGGGAGNVTIVTDGTSIGPVAFNASDTQTAADWVTAALANGTFTTKATASSVGAVITITWGTKGTVGNTKTLTASRTAGTAVASGATLAGGGQGSVDVTVGGTLVTTDTTNLANTPAAAAIAAALDANGTVFALVDSSAATNVVTLTAQAKGTTGDDITLDALSVTGTATTSDFTLTGGAQGLVTLEVGVADPQSVATNTTNLTDAAAATLVATTCNADAGFAALATCTAAGAVVTLAVLTPGVVGNEQTVVATSATGTALPNAQNFTGGTDGAGQYLGRP